ncbi:hypothetical protein [Planococcus sp. MB-3u-03]|nr:hypothetical protein [Planococcus sp. MB-3u-03]
MADFAIGLSVIQTDDGAFEEMRMPPVDVVARDDGWLKQVG